MQRILFSVWMLLLAIGGFTQGTETFTNMPASNSGYSIRTWTGDNNQTWTATDARTDQSINGRAIGIRISKITCNAIPNGISSLSFSYKYIFSGPSANVVVKINGTQVGSTLIIASSETSPQIASFPNLTVSGPFSLEIEQSVSGARLAIDDISWTSNNTTPCVTPTAQPTNLVFSTVTNTATNGSFTAPATAPDAYLVLYSTSNTLSALPVNGTSYVIDDVIGNATVVSAGTTTSFQEAGLAPGTTYYFYVFAYNRSCAGGPLYLSTSPLTANATTTQPPVCATPTAPATVLNLFPTNTSVNGNFTASATAEAYLVVQSSSTLTGFTPVNGTSYTLGQTVGNGVVIKNNAGTTFSNGGLLPGTDYTYTVFAFNGTSCTGGPLYLATSIAGTTTTTNSSNNTGEPAGYYATTAGKNCADLKSTLRTIITNGHNAQTYGSLYNQYAITDIKPREVGTGGANVIWDIYSDRPTGVDPYNFDPFTNRCGNYSIEGDCFNREHSVPQSWFNEAAPAVSDYHHIFPTDGKVNGIRSSFVFGNVATASTTSLNGSKLGSSADAGISGTVFEPIDEYKGDVARAFLYFVTRYENSIPGWSSSTTNAANAFANNTFPAVRTSYLRLMIEWHNQDPVSAKEITRNNGGFSFQGNRNPYVDRPEFVSQVWNNTCAGLGSLVLPADLAFFRGYLKGNQVSLQWQSLIESNFDKYVIQRSVNGTQFTSIGLLKGKGASNYNFNDDITQLTNRRLYYRLQMVDKNGDIKYSEVFTIHVQGSVQITVLPNPVRSTLQVQLAGNTQAGTLQLLNTVGTVTKQIPIAANQSTVSSAVGNLPSGLYTLRFLSDGKVYQQKIMLLQ